MIVLVNDMHNVSSMNVRGDVCFCKSQKKVVIENACLWFLNAQSAVYYQYVTSYLSIFDSY